MSNPFDQFASDFQAALPPVAPGMQTYPSTNAAVGFPPQPQQPGYGSDPYGGSQPGYGAPPPYSHQGPPPSGYSQSPFEQPPQAIPVPFQNDQYASFGAPPPPNSQPPPSIPPSGFGDMPPVDVGNPFASPGLDPTMNASQFGYGAQPNIPQPGIPYSQPGLDFSQRSFNTGPPPSTSMGTPQPEISMGMPPQAPPPPSEYATDSWGNVPPSQPPPPQPYGDMQQHIASPFGSPPPPQSDPNVGAIVMSQQPSNPYMPQGFQPPPADPNAGALVPSQQQSNPYSQVPYGQPPLNPFAAAPYGQQPIPPQQSYGQPPQPYGMMQPPAADPYLQQQQGYGQMYGSPAPPPAQYQQPPPPVDPFSVFDSSQSKAPEPAGPESTAVVPFSPGPNPTAGDDDFWGSFGPNNPDPATTAPAAAPTPVPDRKAEEEKKGDDGNLPPGGEFYDARIFTPTLGVMFFKPQELTDSLFLNTDRDLVDSLLERPVVAFIVEGSSARAAGVELGHVLLKVNGTDVKSPKEASRLIKEGPRPLPLLFYVPNTEVVTAEGEHMVKYDTRETTAPNSAKDWKPKYVVIGGIIAQPWMMNMYRSKVRKKFCCSNRTSCCSASSHRHFLFICCCCI